jgi:hypothetical protein
MNKILLLLPLFFSLNGFSQKDTLSVDRSDEGMHKKTSCVVDTTIVIQDQKSLIIKDTTDWNYEFVSGKKKYLEVSLRTTVCRCTDCSFAEHVLIDITGLKPGDKIKLTSQNTTWLAWNSLMIGHSEINFKGQLVYNSDQSFTLEIYKFVPGKNELKYDGIRVEKR